MKLEFNLKPSFGHFRFYPLNEPALALVRITGRKCFDVQELTALYKAGFEIMFRSVTDELKPFNLIAERKRVDE